ncbi:MAG: endolytic transglycosylase MltG [Flavobacteriaceae bacterium]|nr:endolytic transglycosylase MltG [Flavobacteriaceae bacterium]MCB0474978.1 endolytic transglycosylase MltG [Flavobacteriaceae bacterium]
MKIKKIIAAFFIGVIIVAALIAYKYYSKIYTPNVLENATVYIPTNATFEDVVKVVSPAVDNMNSFIWVALKKNYQHLIKPGKYAIKKGMSNNEVVNLLRSGNQTPVMLTFNNQDSVEKLAGRIAAQIEPDSLQILNALLDPEFLTKNDLNKANILQIFIPNTYEFFWNTSPKTFRERMLKEYKNFWNESRIKKAKAQKLTPGQVMTLASIVQKETAHRSERPVVAGLYLNRLHNYWPLQADPTIIFALKQKYGEDYEVKRILNGDLTIDSPYNTYKNSGLPPALIGMPDISSIDAVLNPKVHDYYYMCASVTNLGFHEFAKTLAQHNVNAEKYRKWVSAQGIKR